MSTPSYPWLLRIASYVIPASGAGRYLAEWAAESEVIYQRGGARAALRYRLDVLAGSPRLSFALRSANRPGIFDWLLVSVTLLVPAVFHAVHAGATNEFILAGLYGCIVAGLALFSLSLWKVDTGLVGNRTAKFGLVLTVVAATAIPVVHRVLDTVTPMSTAPYETLPGSSLVTMGATLLVVSSQFANRRVSIVRSGLLLLLAGLILWSVATIANALAAPTWFEWGYHFGIVPSAFVVSQVCIRVLRSGSFFVVPEGRVIPHR